MVMYSSEYWTITNSPSDDGIYKSITIWYTPYLMRSSNINMVLPTFNLKSGVKILNGDTEEVSTIENPMLIIGS